MNSGGKCDEIRMKGAFQGKFGGGGVGEIRLSN